MASEAVLNYLREHGIVFRLRRHGRAQTAIGIARRLGLDANQVARTIVLDVDGRPWIALVTAQNRVSPERVAQELDARRVEELDLFTLDTLFMDSRSGAEPPFGRMFGLPVVMDEILADQSEFIVRSGSYDDSIQMRVADFLELEQPNVASINALQGGLPVGIEYVEEAEAAGEITREPTLPDDVVL